ncbi:MULTISPECIES: hypothetical protein [Haloarcula]|uniref:PARP-type domain-containing protein n=1 Tax=Haloarcula pellucida TaxID=1427151 RepID=A0A830GQE0_9EURY|nr:MULTISPECIES: hypothetical protein [Halomicroarcula]MBX0350511.1 hypothetical protein [Halomicroarcula pellucida]MDS0280342.1 hypothetical protein [Halomicroarcula sp. S1AR25-4]GGO03663.1 hypothetical protein GCM10009030_39570 [Halomicroarcula pellucida]
MPSETDREQPDCQNCGNPVDTTEPGVWKAANDEQWWHEGCYDKVEKAEELAERIRGLMVPETEFDGLSDEFHDQLDAAQGLLENAAKKERLKQEQEIGHYGTTTNSEGGVTDAE